MDNGEGLLTEFITGPAVSAAPEPASLSLLSLGFAGIAGYVWRRRKTVR